ncbi:conserved hypothetical protein [Ricinus communis]|uniref:RNase H type-1 domain-containing protein n=1 Tax=Ricinus communis TaxID=3988 RepID=B9SWR8_RICCO|nr:conserved hypothetical protein [Ricinus communis]
MVNEYKEHNSGESVSYTPGDTRWLPPSIGWKKDDKGEVCLAANRVHVGNYKAEEAEAFVMSWSLQTAVEKGYLRIKVESDCLSLISKLKADDEVLNELGSIVQYIKDQSRKFLEIKWCRVCRQGNMATHE